MSDYQFTNAWFEENKLVWDHLLSQLNPTKILEVGSFEGASVCYLIEKFGATNDLEIHTIDTWEGGIEHQVIDMSDVEKRFLHNVELALSKVDKEIEMSVHKGFSDQQMAKLLAEDKGQYFDFIYIDGSHQAPDVLCDAILGFKLLRVGGILAFDDYLWNESLPYGKDPIRCPKVAVDAFTNIFCRKISVIGAPLRQVYVQKIAA